MAGVFWGEIEETVENICGVVDYDKHAFFVTCTEDDPIDREYTIHQVYDDKAPDTVYIFRTWGWEEIRRPSSIQFLSYTWVPFDSAHF